MSTQRQSGSMGDELTNILMVGLAALFGLILAIRGAGSVAAFVTGADQPQTGIAGGLAVLFSPGDPAGALHSDGLNPIAYWIILTLMLGLLGAAGTWVWIKWRRHSRAVDVDPHRLAGTATSYEVATAASANTLVRHAGTLRPSLNSPHPPDVGFLLGQSKGKQVWASVEDSILLIGPPRSGKGLHIVIPRSSTHPVPWSPPAPGPTTSPPHSRPGSRSGQSPSSTPSTWLRAFPPGCVGHPSAAATTHSPP